MVAKVLPFVPRVGQALDFEPIGDWVLFEPLPRTETPGGIALPADAQEQISRIRILKVGPGRKTDFGVFVEVDQVEEGDIFFASFFQDPIFFPYAGKKLGLCRARDLVGKQSKPEVLPIAQALAA